jgi:tetratricopeptide (TPR) repeat protein
MNWQDPINAFWRRLRQVNYDIETYRKLSLQTGDTAMAHVLWAVDLAEAGHWQQAETKLEKAAQLAPKREEPLINWGVILAKQGRLLEAVAKFEQAAELNPKRGSIAMLHGAALVELGRADEAIPYYQKAIDLNPDHPEPLINWAIALSRAGYYAQAQAKLRAALACQPNADQPWFLLGTLYAEQHAYADAVTAFTRCLQLHPKHPDARYFLALVYNHQGDYAKVVSTIKLALEHDPDNGHYYLCLGDALANLGRFDVALANYRHASKLLPEQAQPWVSLGRALRAIDKPTEALQAFAQAERLLNQAPCPEAAPQAQDMLGQLAYDIGTTLAQLNRWAEACQLLEQSLATQPEGQPASPDHFALLIRCYAQLGQLSNLEATLAEQVRYWPNHAHTLYAQTVKALASGQWQRAFDLLAQLASQRRDTTPSVGWIDKVFADRTCPITFTLVQATCLWQLGQSDDALRLARTTYRQNDVPALAKARAILHYANLLALTGHPQRATDKWQELSERLGQHEALTSSASPSASTTDTPLTPTTHLAGLLHASQVLFASPLSPSALPITAQGLLLQTHLTSVFKVLHTAPNLLSPETPLAYPQVSLAGAALCLASYRLSLAQPTLAPTTPLPWLAEHLVKVWPTSSLAWQLWLCHGMGEHPMVEVTLTLEQVNAQANRLWVLSCLAHALQHLPPTAPPQAATLCDVAAWPAPWQGLMAEAWQHPHTGDDELWLVTPPLLY